MNDDASDARPEIADNVTTRKLQGSFWPSPLQERLLDAALGDPQGAITAWRASKSQFDLEVLEPGSFQLMPLIYRQLNAGGSEDPLLDRLKGIYRREWVRNNLLLERTRTTAEALDAVGVPALFIEGAALAARFYPDLGFRPTGFVDVLVNESSAGDAVEALSEAGWLAGPAADVGPAGMRYLRDSDQNTCVLRTGLAFDFVLRGDPTHSHEPLWEAAEVRELGGVGVRVPSPSDTLLALCVTGARSHDPATIQWIVDAAMVLRTEPVDWERVIDLGTSRGQARRLADAFTYLSRLPGPHPPSEAVDSLGRVPQPLRGRLAYALSTGSARRLGAFSDILAEHLVATADKPAAHAIVTLPSELRNRWELDSMRQLPGAAYRRVRRLVSRRKVEGS